MDWFLRDRDLFHERVNNIFEEVTFKNITKKLF